MAITAAPVRSNARKTTNGFWWANLSTSDDTAAAAFYSRMFGWDYQTAPISDSMVHRNATLNGQRIAGIDPLMPGSEWPTAWTNYVYVEDINVTCESAKKLGATIAMEPMDVMGEGWMAIVIDPAGAAFGVWQPGRHTGADAVNQPGTYGWVEHASDDVEGSKRFYGELFGWGFEKMEGAPMEYWLATLEGRQFAGLMPRPKEMVSMGAPPCWITYFCVADVDATFAEVKAAGGNPVFEPMQMGPGRGFGATDPQGGFFTVIQLDEWPAD